MTDAIREGLSERKVERDKDDDDTKETKVKSRKARVADEKSVVVESDDDAEDLDDEDLDEEIDE